MGRGGRGQREGEEVNGEKDRLETDCMVETKTDLRQGKTPAIRDSLSLLCCARCCTD